MPEKIQNFFLELRQGDEATKKRWLVILTSASMMLVVALWVAYLNFALADLGPKPPIREEVGILKTSQAGIQIIFNKIGGELNRTASYLQSLAKQTNSITIQNASVNVVAKNLEEIKPKKFP